MRGDARREHQHDCPVQRAQFRLQDRPRGRCARLPIRTCACCHSFHPDARKLRAAPVRHRTCRCAWNRPLESGDHTKREWQRHGDCYGPFRPPRKGP
ncbi:hypothetical protein BSLA_02r1102 [Burkholderia stabilis]|nr:hypothetical protein BSLA_02r1102 [Burkholderia stabilis]